MAKLLFSEAFLKYPGGDAGGGFNSRILGHSRNEAMQNFQYAGSRESGWHAADKLAREGKLYAVHNFHHSHECKGHAFPYGGTFVCNECNRSRLDEPWWAIKCYPDGNAWCCVGLDFEDLQSSDCFAFGDTYEAAISAYGDLMTARAQVPA